MHTTYLIADLIFLAGWLILYLLRGDLRKPMLGLSIIGGTIAPLYELIFFTRDWWHPLTITATRIGIEDFLQGFAVAGISTALYKTIFRKKSSPLAKKSKTLLLGALIILSTLVSIFFIFAFKLPSYYAAFGGMLVVILFIYFLRKDLIFLSVASGTLFAILAIPGYFIINLIDPGFVQRWWTPISINNFLLFGAPASDILFYFIAAALISPMYDFTQPAKIEKL